MCNVFSSVRKLILATPNVFGESLGLWELIQFPESLSTDAGNFQGAERVVELNLSKTARDVVGPVGSNKLV